MEKTITKINLVNDITVKSKAVYSEILGENRIIYRVTENFVVFDGEPRHTYGVEIECLSKDDKISEKIDDFSVDLQETVSFVEMLIRNCVMPSSLYDIALDYLSRTI